MSKYYVLCTCLFMYYACNMIFCYNVISENSTEYTNTHYQRTGTYYVQHIDTKTQCSENLSKEILVYQRTFSYREIKSNYKQKSCVFSNELV